jgi:hypothetical protein
MQMPSRLAAAARSFVGGFLADLGCRIVMGASPPHRRDVKHRRKRGARPGPTPVNLLRRRPKCVFFKRADSGASQLPRHPPVGERASLDGPCGPAASCAWSALLGMMQDAWRASRGHGSGHASCCQHGHQLRTLRAAGRRCVQSCDSAGGRWPSCRWADSRAACAHTFRGRTCPSLRRQVNDLLVFGGLTPDAASQEAAAQCAAWLPWRAKRAYVQQACVIPVSASAAPWHPWSVPGRACATCCTRRKVRGPASLPLPPPHALTASGSCCRSLQEHLGFAGLPCALAGCRCVAAVCTRLRGLARRKRRG